jgi:hypothetical protein
MDMPFAPLSANIVCWNNQMTIENEELRRIECSQRLPKGLPSGDSSDTVFSNETDLPTICQQPSKDTACCRQELVINEELVISGWNVADGYLPPTVPLTQLLWKGQRKKQNLQSSKAFRNIQNLQPGTPSMLCHTAQCKILRHPWSYLLRSSAFRRNEDGFTNTYRTGALSRPPTWSPGPRFRHVSSRPLSHAN